MKHSKARRVPLGPLQSNALSKQTADQMQPLSKVSKQATDSRRASKQPKGNVAFTTPAAAAFPQAEDENTSAASNHTATHRLTSVRRAMPSSIPKPDSLVTPAMQRSGRNAATPSTLIGSTGATRWFHASPLTTRRPKVLSRLQLQAAAPVQTATPAQVPAQQSGPVAEDRTTAAHPAVMPTVPAPAPAPQTAQASVEQADTAEQPAVAQVTILAEATAPEEAQAAWGELTADDQPVVTVQHASLDAATPAEQLPAPGGHAAEEQSDAAAQHADDVEAVTPEPAEQVPAPHGTLPARPNTLTAASAQPCEEPTSESADLLGSAAQLPAGSPPHTIAASGSSTAANAGQEGPEAVSKQGELPTNPVIAMASAPQAPASTIAAPAHSSAANQSPQPASGDVSSQADLPHAQARPTSPESSCSNASLSPSSSCTDASLCSETSEAEVVNPEGSGCLATPSPLLMHNPMYATAWTPQLGAPSTPALVATPGPDHCPAFVLPTPAAPAFTPGSHAMALTAQDMTPAAIALLSPGPPLGSCFPAGMIDTPAIVPSNPQPSRVSAGQQSTAAAATVGCGTPIDFADVFDLQHYGATPSAVKAASAVPAGYQDLTPGLILDAAHASQATERSLQAWFESRSPGPAILRRRALTPAMDEPQVSPALAAMPHGSPSASNATPFVEQLMRARPALSPEPSDVHPAEHQPRHVASSQQESVGQLSFTADTSSALATPPAMQPLLEAATPAVVAANSQRKPSIPRLVLRDRSNDHDSDQYLSSHVAATPQLSLQAKHPADHLASGSKTPALLFGRASQQHRLAVSSAPTPRLLLGAVAAAKLPSNSLAFHAPLLLDMSSPGEPQLMASTASAKAPTSAEASQAAGDACMPHVGADHSCGSSSPALEELPADSASAQHGQSALASNAVVPDAVPDELIDAVIDAELAPASHELAPTSAQSGVYPPLATIAIASPGSPATILVASPVSLVPPAPIVAAATVAKVHAALPCTFSSDPAKANEACPSGYAVVANVLAPSLAAAVGMPGTQMPANRPMGTTLPHEAAKPFHQLVARLGGHASNHAQDDDAAAAVTAAQASLGRQPAVRPSTAQGKRAREHTPFQLMLAHLSAGSYASPGDAHPSAPANAADSPATPIHQCSRLAPGLRVPDGPASRLAAPVFASPDAVSSPDGKACDVRAAASATGFSTASPPAAACFGASAPMLEPDAPDSASPASPVEGAAACAGEPLPLLELATTSQALSATTVEPAEACLGSPAGMYEPTVGCFGSPVVSAMPAAAFLESPISPSEPAMACFGSPASLLDPEAGCSASPATPMDAMAAALESPTAGLLQFAEAQQGDSAACASMPFVTPAPTVPQHAITATPVTIGKGTLEGWLGRMGLNDDINTPARLDLQRLWGAAGEVKELRQLIQTVKESELDIARAEAAEHQLHWDLMMEHSAQVEAENIQLRAEVEEIQAALQQLGLERHAALGHAALEPSLERQASARLEADAVEEGVQTELPEVEEAELHRAQVLEEASLIQHMCQQENEMLHASLQEAREQLRAAQAQAAMADSEVQTSSLTPCKPSIAPSSLQHMHTSACHAACHAVGVDCETAMTPVKQPIQPVCSAECQTSPLLPACADSNTQTTPAPTPRALSRVLAADESLCSPYPADAAHAQPIVASSTNRAQAPAQQAQQPQRGKVARLVGSFATAGASSAAADSARAVPVFFGAHRFFPPARPTAPAGPTAGSARTAHAPLAPAGPSCTATTSQSSSGVPAAPAAASTAPTSPILPTSKDQASLVAPPNLPVPAQLAPGAPVEPTASGAATAVARTPARSAEWTSVTDRLRRLRAELQEAQRKLDRVNAAKTPVTLRKRPPSLAPGLPASPKPATPATPQAVRLRLAPAAEVKLHALDAPVPTSSAAQEQPNGSSSAGHVPPSTHPVGNQMPAASGACSLAEAAMSSPCAAMESGRQVRAQLSSQLSSQLIAASPEQDSLTRARGVVAALALCMAEVPEESSSAVMQDAIPAMTSQPVQAAAPSQQQGEEHIHAPLTTLHEIACNASMAAETEASQSPVVADSRTASAQTPDYSSASRVAPDSPPHVASAVTSGDADHASAACDDANETPESCSPMRSCGQAQAHGSSASASADLEAGLANPTSANAAAADATPHHTLPCSICPAAALLQAADAGSHHVTSPAADPYQTGSEPQPAERCNSGEAVRLCATPPPAQAALLPAQHTASRPAADAVPLATCEASVAAAASALKAEVQPTRQTPELQQQGHVSVDEDQPALQAASMVEVETRPVSRTPQIVPQPAPGAASRAASMIDTETASVSRTPEVPRRERVTLSIPQPVFEESDDSEGDSPDRMMPVRRTSGRVPSETDEREFRRRAAALRIRISPYFKRR